MSSLGDLMRDNPTLHLNRLLIQIGLAVAPIVPMIGFHCSQASRLFRAGFSLADLRTALDVAWREHDEEAAAFDATVHLSSAKRALRLGTYGAMGAALATIAFAPHRFLVDDWRIAAIIGTWVTAGVLIVSSNANEVPLLPEFVRRAFRVDLRERLWRSRLGAALSRRLGAPASSRPIGAGVFRATESALGTAATDLHAMLPKDDRERLHALPGVVRSLEARAVAARSRLEELEALSARAGAGDTMLADQRASARAQLSESVAALEGIRLDLLRLHAGTTDLAPLTTLLDAARLIGEDVSRMAEAHREARSLGDHRLVTPV